MFIYSLFIGVSITISIIILIMLITSYICFRLVFFANRKKDDNGIYQIPPGEEYLPHKDKFIEFIDIADNLNQTNVSIKSFDGTILRGRYFEYSKDAPIELMFHGYKGTSRRDLSGGVVRCLNLKRSVLIVDHRGSGLSDGNIITFGVKESKDCLEWIKFILNNINPNAEIILTGISMGASTVMITSSKELPKNIIGIIADCGYTSGKNIIKKVIKDLKLPPALFFPFVRLGGLIFGGFDINNANCSESLKSCNIPIIFFHGDSDNFIPHQMSVDNYNICTSNKKKLVTINNAGHGLCYVFDSKLYETELFEFFNHK